MPFITQGKTNWKFLLIVVVLAAIVGGGILWSTKNQIQFQNNVVQDSCSIDSDCQFYCGCGCVLKNTQGCPKPNFACEYDSCNSCRCLDGKCVSWSEVFIEAQYKKDISLCQEIQNEDCKNQCLEALTNLIEANETAEIADWQTYRNEEYGFEFKYPGIFDRFENCKLIKNDNTIAVGSRFVISILDAKESNLLEYVAKEREESLREQVFPPPEEAWHQEDIYVGGIKGIKVVWFHGPRYSQIIYFLKDNIIFEIGWTAGISCLDYYVGQGLLDKNEVKNELYIFEQIPNTFKFID